MPSDHVLARLMMMMVMVMVNDERGEIRKRMSEILFVYMYMSNLWAILVVLNLSLHRYMPLFLSFTLAKH